MLHAVSPRPDLGDRSMLDWPMPCWWQEERLKAHALAVARVHKHRNIDLVGTVTATTRQVASRTKAAMAQKETRKLSEWEFAT